MDRRRISFAALAACALAFVALPSPPANAMVTKVCKQDLFKGPWSSPKPYQQAAKNTAVDFWRNAVNETLGQPWSNWTLSKHQLFACRNNPPPTGGVVCQAKAQPCRQDKQPSASIVPPLRVPLRGVISRPGAREPFGIRRPPQFTGGPRFSGAPMMRRRPR
jgi:hypothetical protein